MYVKICECCGKRFPSKSKSKKCCSKECSREMTRRRREEDGQLCWLCKNACSGCVWTKRFKPISGWVAEPTVIKNDTGDTSSYSIKRCPEFIRG